MVTQRSTGLAALYPEKCRRLRYLLAITSLLFLAGLFSPIITLNKFIVVENTFSVVGGVVGLLHDGQIFLFVLVGAFSILLPALKLGVLYRLLSGTTHAAGRLPWYLHLMHLYGKWSMLDVFVVAVLVVAVKLGVIASVEMRFGLYLFAAAMLLTMIITSRVVGLSRDAPSA